MKKTDDAVKIARYISEFLDVYAPNFLASVDKGIHNKTTKYGLPTY